MMRPVLESFKRMWVAWGGFARGLLIAQNWVLMSFAYVFAIGPVALAMRLGGRRMIDRAPPEPGASSYWRPRSGKPMSMDEASRMF